MKLEDIKITDIKEFYKQRDILSKLAERVTKDEFEQIEEEENAVEENAVKED
ncbi:MAG: hypothetical protein RR348_04795 [Clostridia bacterium]